MVDADGMPRFSPLTKADLDGVFALFEVAFDDWPGFPLDVNRREHLEWKVHSTADSLRLSIGAHLDGEIVGAIIRVDRRLKLGDRVVSAQSGGDSSMLPRLQGQGLFSRMRKASVEQARENSVAMHLLFPGHPAALQSWLSTGLVPRRTKSGLLLKPLDVMQAAGQTERLRGRLPRPIMAAGVLAAVWMSRLRHGRSNPPAVDGFIATIDQFDASVSEFWASASQDFDFIPVRDRDYLNWRYCDPRAGGFTVRAATMDGRLDGYLVLKFRDGRAHVVDVLARSGRLDVVERLIWDAVRVARQRSADAVACQLPVGHPYWKTVQRAGFFDTGGRWDFGGFALAMDPAPLDIIEQPGTRIHVTRGDTDLV